jgi:hypothetical protein
MTGHRVDLAQADIVRALRDVGATWVDMTQQRPSVGYDGIIVFRGQLWLVEIKTPGQWSFTPREVETQKIFAQGGVTIWVVESVVDVLALIGVI